MAPARLIRVAVPVVGIEAAAAFYSAVLDDPGRRISAGRHYFGCGHAILACVDARADGDTSDHPPNPDHLYLAVQDLERCLERVQAAGGAVQRTIETQPWGEHSFFCTDPFGNKLCFVDEPTMFRAGLI